MSKKVFTLHNLCTFYARKSVERLTGRTYIMIKRVLELKNTEISQIIRENRLRKRLSIANVGSDDGK